MPDTTPTQAANAWLEAFAAALQRGDSKGASALFAQDGCWRDLLSFTWNIKTMEGPAAIAAMLDATLAAASPSGWKLAREAQVEHGDILAWFTFETPVASCLGRLQLRGGKCRALFTMTDELKGFEERKGRRRPLGVRHMADPGRETWLEERSRRERELGVTVQPYCLVIGGGQGGIMLAARLKQLGVPTIVVEKNARAGDSWRKRYRSLVLHDPVWYDHLPYIPFPPNWPVFTPKDKMGDWLEMYVKVMELDYWAGTECKRASYDEAAQRWTVEVERDGRLLTLTPAHLVFATGAYGPPRRVALPGSETFSGEVLHSSDYADGSRFRDKKCVVIGAASSGHDVSVDLWESGAQVTMVQRSPTTVVRSQTLLDLAFDDYSEDALERGVDVDEADRITASTPFAQLPESQKRLYDKIRARDADFYDRLAASGFLLDFGDDETGLLMKAYRTGSGYYIDVGASQLIIDGKIRVKSGVGIERLTRHGVLFQDGEELPADAVIACTGYQSMHETVAALVSRETADRVGPCWGLGSGVRGDPGPWQGDLRNMWKPTAQEALWFHGGNLALSRFYSKILALQIKARMEGIETPVQGRPH